MKILKTKKKRVWEEEVIEQYTLCDKCKEKILTSGYDDFECVFRCTTGDSFPEGGSGEKWRLDLCQKCSEEAIKLLNDNGFEIQKSKWDW